MESTRRSQYVKTRWKLSEEEPKLLIRLFIHAVLRNGVHFVKKLET